jgi:hypothetical protein
MANRQGRADFGFAIVTLGVCALTWREASNLPPALFDPLGPKTFPLWISGLLAALAVLILLRLALGRSIGASRTSLITGLGDDPSATHRTRPGLAAATFLLTAAYAAALSVPGLRFAVATAGYVLALILTLGPRRRRDVMIAALVSVAGAGAIDLLFRVVFAVDLQ